MRTPTNKGNKNKKQETRNKKQEEDIGGDPFLNLREYYQKP